MYTMLYVSFFSARRLIRGTNYFTVTVLPHFFCLESLCGQQCRLSVLKDVHINCATSCEELHCVQYCLSTRAPAAGGDKATITAATSSLQP